MEIRVPFRSSRLLDLYAPLFTYLRMGGGRENEEVDIYGKRKDFLHMYTCRKLIVRAVVLPKRDSYKIRTKAFITHQPKKVTPDHIIWVSARTPFALLCHGGQRKSKKALFVFIWHTFLFSYRPARNFLAQIGKKTGSSMNNGGDRFEWDLRQSFRTP